MTSFGRNGSRAAARSWATRSRLISPRACACDSTSRKRAHALASRPDVLPAIGEVKLRAQPRVHLLALRELGARRGVAAVGHELLRFVEERLRGDRVGGARADGTSNRKARVRSHRERGTGMGLFATVEEVVSRRRGGLSGGVVARCGRG